MWLTKLAYVPAYLIVYLRGITHGRGYVTMPQLFSTRGQTFEWGANDYNEVKTVDTTILKRQFITDAKGKAVGVILSLDQYAMVASILENNFSEQLPNVPIEDSVQTDITSIKEASFFGMWSDRSDLQQSSSRAWLEEVRQK